MARYGIFIALALGSAAPLAAQDIGPALDPGGDGGLDGR